MIVNQVSLNQNGFRNSGGLLHYIMCMNNVGNGNRIEIRLIFNHVGNQTASVTGSFAQYIHDKINETVSFRYTESIQQSTSIQSLGGRWRF